MATHEGIPSKVKNRNGNPCPAASKRDYPLSATCQTCGNRIVCADGSADWAHASDLLNHLMPVYPSVLI